MGKIKNTVGIIAIILSSTGIFAAGGSVAAKIIEQPKDGANGKNGSAWYSGTTNINEITIGDNGDFYYDTDDFKLYQKENNEWVLKINNFGKPGEQGAQGEQGDKGETGDKGIQGEQGLKGETGEQGAQGEQGLKGEAGDKGAQGIQGIQGEKGSTGEKGDPGTNGTNGTNGSSSYVWIKYSDSMPDDDSDLKDEASNFIGIYSGTSSTAPKAFGSYTWFEIKGAKGDKGSDGEQGDKGATGESGTSVYIGYDGYVWNGSVRTEYKIHELDSLCAENTLELYSSEYFEKKLIDVNTKQIALTGEYYSNIKKTIYDGLKLNKITVYTDKAGDLQIGKISLLDGTVSDLKKYTVTEGKNEIDLSAVSMGANQTIVIGGNQTTVKLYKSVGVTDALDTYGNFTIVDETFAVENSKTGEVLDKLICKVEIQEIITQTTSKIFEDPIAVGGNISSMAAAVPSSGPFRYEENYFGGKTITQIGVPVKTYGNGNFCYFIIKKDIGNLDANTAANRINYQEIVIPYEGDKSKALNQWLYVDVNIILAEDETLAFGTVSGGISWGYVSGISTYTKAQEKYKFIDNKLTEYSKGNIILFDISYIDTVVKNIAYARSVLVAEEEA